MVLDAIWILLIYFASTVFGQQTLAEVCPEVTDNCFVITPNQRTGEIYADSQPFCVNEFCNEDGNLLIILGQPDFAAGESGFCWAPQGIYYCPLSCHQHPKSWYRCTGDYVDNPPEDKDLIKVTILTWNECAQDTSGGGAWQKDLRYKASSCNGIIEVYASDDADCANPIATLNYDVNEAVTSVDGTDDPVGTCTDLVETDLSGNSAVLTQSDVICIESGDNAGLSITLNGCQSQVGLLVPLPAIFDLSTPNRKCAGYPNVGGFENLGVVPINQCDDRCNDARQKGTDVIQGCCMHTPAGCFFNENINGLELGDSDSFAGLAEAACIDTTGSCESWIRPDTYDSTCGPLISTGEQTATIPDNDEGRQCLSYCCSEYGRCTPPCSFGRPTAKPTEEVRTSLSPTIATTLPEPTPAPTPRPTLIPTTSPTSAPTDSPSMCPSGTPSQHPSKHPVTSRPTVSPITSRPSVQPTCHPSSSPTAFPTVSPTAQRVHLRVIIDEEIITEGLGKIIRETVEIDMDVGTVEIYDTGYYFEVDMHFPEAHDCADTDDLYDARHASDVILQTTDDTVYYNRTQTTCTINRDELYLRFLYHLYDDEADHAVFMQNELDAEEFAQHCIDAIALENNPHLDGVVIDHTEYWTLTDFYYYPHTDEQSEEARSTWNVKTSVFYTTLLNKSHAIEEHFHVEVLASECNDGTWKIDTGNVFGYAEYCYGNRFAAACVSTAGVIGGSSLAENPNYDSGKLALLICESLGFHEGYYGWKSDSNPFWETNRDLPSIFNEVTQLQRVPEFANIDSSDAICPNDDDLHDVHYCELGKPWLYGEEANCAIENYLALECDAHPKATFNEFGLYCVNMDPSWFGTDPLASEYHHALEYTLEDIIQASQWDLLYTVYDSITAGGFEGYNGAFDFDWSDTVNATGRLLQAEPWLTYQGPNGDNDINPVTAIYVDYVSYANDAFHEWKNVTFFEPLFQKDLVKYEQTNEPGLLFSEWGSYCYMSQIQSHDEEIPVCDETKMEQYFDATCSSLIFAAKHNDVNVTAFWQKCECMNTEVVASMRLDSECRTWKYDENTIGGQAEVCMRKQCRGGVDPEIPYGVIEGYIARPCGTYTYNEVSTKQDCMKLCDAQPDCHGFNWLVSEGNLCSLCTNHFDVVRDELHQYDMYYMKDVSCDPTPCPTSSPTDSPTFSPSDFPTTTIPTVAPSFVPSTTPSFSPSKTPSSTPSLSPSKNPTINECNVLLFAQYKRDYDECIQFTETYQAFPTTYEPITWSMRCFCFREIAAALADDPSSVEDQGELHCRIKQWEDLNLLTLLYDCYGEDIPNGDLNGYDSFTGDDCYYGIAEYFSGYRRQYNRKFVASEWAEDSNVQGSCLTLSGASGDYDVEACIAECKDLTRTGEECQAFNVDSTNSTCQICNGIIHTTIDSDWTAYYASDDPGCNPTMAPTSPPSDVPTATPTDAPSRTPTQSPTDPVCDSTALTATTYDMINAGKYECYTELIGKLLRIEADDWVQLTENNMCNCVIEFQDWDDAEFNRFSCRLFAEDDRNLQETLDNCEFSRESENCDFNGWPKIDGMKSTQCAAELYGEQAKFQGSIRECINRCAAQPSCHSFNYYHNETKCDLCTGLYSLQYAETVGVLPEELTYYYEGDCLSLCHDDAFKSVVEPLPQCDEDMIQFKFLVSHIGDACRCLDGVVIPELDEAGEINELNYCMLNKIDTVSFHDKVEFCRSSECHRDYKETHSNSTLNITSAVYEDLPYAWIPDAELENCNTRIEMQSTSTVWDCLELCTQTRESDIACYAVNFEQDPAAGVSVCELCGEASRERIVPNEAKQLWYNKNCETTDSPTESPTHEDCQGSASYQIYYFPEDGMNYGSSGFVAAAHNRNFYMWVEGPEMYTANFTGLEQFMQNGDVNMYRDVLLANDGENIELLDLSRYYSRPQIDFMLVKTDAAAPMFSFVGKLLDPGTAADANSHLDLAIGYDSFELCHYYGYWVQNATIPLYAYDMGPGQEISETSTRIGTLQIQRICPIQADDCGPGFIPIDPAGGTCYQSCEAIPTRQPTFLPTESPTYTNCNGERKFHIIFQPDWANNPDVTAFDRMIAVVSTRDYTLWEDGAVATSSMAQYALFGETMYIETEITDYVVPNTTTMPISDTKMSHEISVGTDFTYVDIHSATEFGYISLASRIIPSPDWMVGLEHQSLCTQTTSPIYRNRAIVNAYYVDAGVSSTTIISADVRDYEAIEKKVDAKTQFQSDQYGQFIIQKFNCPDYDLDWCENDEGCMVNEDNDCVSAFCEGLNLGTCNGELVDTTGDGCQDACVASHVDDDQGYWELRTPGYLGRCINCPDCTSTTRQPVSDFDTCRSICQNDVTCRAFSTQHNLLTGGKACEYYYDSQPSQVVILENFESFCYVKTCPEVTCSSGFEPRDNNGDGCYNEGLCFDCDPPICGNGEIPEDIDGDECQDVCIPASFHEVGTRVLLTHDGVVYPGSVALYESSTNEYSLKLDNGGYITGKKASDMSALSPKEEPRTTYLEQELVEAYVNNAWTVAEVKISPFTACPTESASACAGVNCNVANECPRTCGTCETYTVNITGTYYPNIPFQSIRPHWMQYRIGSRVETYMCDFDNATIIERDGFDGSYLTTDEYGLTHWRDMASLRPGGKVFIVGEVVQALMAFQNRVRDGYVVTINYEVGTYTIAFIGYNIETVDADRVYAYRGEELGFATDEGCLLNHYWCGSQQVCLVNDQGGCAPTVTPTDSPTESPTYRICAYEELLILTSGQSVVCQEAQLVISRSNLPPSVDDRCRCFDTINQTYAEWYENYSCLWFTDAIPLSEWWTTCESRTCPGTQGYYMIENARMVESCTPQNAQASVDYCRSQCNAAPNNTCIGFNFRQVDATSGDCELCSLEHGVVSIDTSWDFYYRTVVTACQEGSGLDETLPECVYTDFASQLVESTDPTCGPVGTALHDGTVGDLLKSDPESFCSCIDATIAESHLPFPNVLYDYDCNLDGRNFFDDYDAYCNRTVAECAQAIYDTIGDPAYTQCSEMISGYEQHNLPDDETHCFCFSQILADNDLQIYVDSVQRPFTQFDLDCEFIYPQYNLYMKQYSDYCRSADLCVDESTACVQVATYSNCGLIPSIRETCKKSCSEYDNDAYTIVECISSTTRRRLGGSGRNLLSAVEDTARRRELQLIDNREKYLKGARIAYQSEDGYVRWKNDDGTYAIQTLNNNVHLNVQENQLSLSPSIVYSAGTNVAIQVCYHRYGTVQARNVDGSYIVVHDPIPEDSELLKNNPLLDRVHVIGGQDLYLDLNYTLSPHSNVKPANMFELYYDPHFLLGDRVIVTVNNQEREGFITDMDYETNRYSIHFFDIDTPLYGIPYEEISYSR